MSVENFNKGNEKLVEENSKEFKKNLVELKNQISKPGQVTYLRESSDKQYKIYKYEVAQGGTKGGIKKRYTEQIGAWVEGTQFTDANGKEITKDKFSAGEIVYLRVPKNKESNNQAEIKKTPGKVEYLGNKKDKQNRNWKWYSYTFAQGGTVNGAIDKWYDQIGGKIDSRRLKYCDKDGNKLKKERFGKGETIYIKVPNTDIIDPTPEMTSNDIMNIGKNVLEKLMDDNDDSYVYHYDKNGAFFIINGKKIYYLAFNNQNYIIENKPFVYTFGYEHRTVYVAMIKKVGNKYLGVSYDEGEEDIYRGNFLRGVNEYYEFSEEQH